MAFKYGVMLTILAQITTNFALPPCTCTRNFQPVCGSDGQTYSNECLLECAAASTESTLTISQSGPCDLPVPASCICTLIYSPVCGTDGRTYPNECELNCQKTKFNSILKVEHSGACKNPPGPIDACPAIDMPVCGSDGNTYGNECMLKSAANRTPGLTMAKDGPCVQKVQVKDI